jgi:hypothetical protein
MTETLIVGMQKNQKALFDERPPLFWDRDKKEAGYHSITWERVGARYAIKDKSFLWGTGHEAQAGASLESISARKGEGWIWAREPPRSFQGAQGFYIQNLLLNSLNEISEGAALGDLETFPTLYSDAYLTAGFDTIDAIADGKRRMWQMADKATDAMLNRRLNGGIFSMPLQILSEGLLYLASAEGEMERSELKGLLGFQEPTDEHIRRVCTGISPFYEMYDATGAVQRTEDGRKIIVPDDKIFANVDNVRVALKELRTELA